MHWVRTTAPNGRENWINLASAINILESDEGGSIVFFPSIAGGESGQTRYLTTAAKEHPEELLSIMPFDPSAAPVKDAPPVTPVSKKKTGTRGK